MGCVPLKLTHLPIKLTDFLQYFTILEFIVFHIADVYSKLINFFLHAIHAMKNPNLYDGN